MAMAHIIGRTCILVFMTVLLVVTGAWLFRVQIAETALSQMLGRDVNIAGEVDVGWDANPSIHVTRLGINNPSWARHDMLLRVRSASLAVDSSRLFKSREIHVKLGLDRPVLHLERSRSGSTNWHTGNQQGKSSSAPPLNLDVDIRNGLVTYVGHASSTKYELQVDDLEAHVDDALAFSVRGSGSFSGRPLRFSAHGGDPGESSLHTQPYPFAVDITAGAAQLCVHGSLDNPLHVSKFETHVEAHGDNLAQFAPLDEPGAFEQPFNLSGRLYGTAGKWAFSGVEGAVGKSRFNGKLEMGSPQSPQSQPELRGELSFEKLEAQHIAELYKIASSGAEAGDGRREDSLLQEIAAFDASVDIRVGEIVGASLPVGPIALNVDTGNHRIAMELLTAKVADGNAQGSLVLKSADKPLSGEISLRMDKLKPVPILEMFSGNVVQGQLADSTMEGKLNLQFSASGIDAASGQFRLAVPRGRTGIHIDLERVKVAGAWSLRASAVGKLRGVPLDATFTGRPLSLLTSRDAVWPFTLEMSLAKSRIEMTGEIRGMGKEFDVKAHMSGPGTTSLEKATGLSLPRIPKFDVAGRMIWHPPLIKFKQVDAKVGDSDLSGSGAYNWQHGKRSMDIDARAKNIEYQDFDQLQTAAGNDNNNNNWTDWIDSIDANVNIKAARIVAPGNVVVGDVLLRVVLNDGRIEAKPIRFDVADGSVTARALLRTKGSEILGGVVSADIKDVDLGYALKPFSLGDQMPGLLSADINLRLGARAGDVETRSTISYEDGGLGNDLSFVLRQSEEGLRVEGKGFLLNEPFRLHGQADSVEQAFNRQPYAFDMRMHLLQTDVEFTGSMASLWRLAGLKSTLAVAGPDLRKVAPVIGFQSPELPPYRLKGRLTHKGHAWRFSNIQGRVGDSDLGGEIMVDRSKDKPLVQGRLYSKYLDFDDLAGIVGATPDTRSGETSSVEQKSRSAAARGKTTVLPDRAFDFAALSDFNADLRYQAAAIDSDAFPLARLGVDVSLAKGRLRVNPVIHGQGGGTIDARLVLQTQARSPSAQASMDLAVNGIAMSEFFKQYQLLGDSRGTINGTVSLKAGGRSVAEMLGTVNGSGTLTMADGALDALVVELGGLDGGEAMLLWLGKERLVSVRCARVSAVAENGTVHLTTAVLDTTDTKFTMKGTVGLAKETLDIVLKAHPKDFSVFVARAPFKVEGTFKQPQFHPVWSSLFLRGAAALLLGAITPPAALLALIEPGFGDNAQCDTKAPAKTDQ